MPTAVAWQIEGDEQFSRALRLLYEQQRDYTRLWPQVAAKFWEIERRLFDSAGGRASGWPDLSPAYATAKEIEHPGQPILRATGDLFRSLTRGPSDENAVYSATPDNLTLGTRLEYAAYHQTGTSRLPARPVIDLTERDYVELRDVARDHFQRLGLELGFKVYS